MKTAVSGLLVGLLLPCVAMAHVGEAHVHGRAVVQLVQEGNRINVTLVVPAADVVGFEHPPRTDEQIAALREAALTLGDVVSLFEPPESAACSQQWSRVHSDLMDYLDVETLAGNHQHDHQHGEGHRHGHDHEHADEHSHQHADFDAEWHLVCAAADAFDNLRVHIFETLPGLERLTVQAVLARGQQEIRLRRGDERLRWR